MTKWADFLISAVAYDSKHQILYAKQHKDTGESLSDGVLVDRNTLISNLKKGISYFTIFGTNSTWKKGSSLRTYRIGGEYFIRVDGNNVRLDNLGQLPELEIPKETKIDEKKKLRLQVNLYLLGNLCQKDLARRPQNKESRKKTLRLNRLQD